MNPGACVSQDHLVVVLVLAGILAALLAVHFLVVIADLQKQVRELRRALRGFPGYRP